MEKVIGSRVRALKFGAVQTCDGLAVMPLIAEEDGGFQYRTLSEALADWDIAITEISAAGSVPELRVVNRSDMPVLLVDGEELAGGKKNRVLDASILVKPVAETRIPVICTERGRWAYTSKAFKESGNMLAYESRSRKKRAVHRALADRGAPESSQEEVWTGIARLQAKAATPSPTSALSDVFKVHEGALRHCAQVFAPVANQAGSLVFIGGRPAGLEMISVASAYARLHPKLVRSYALEELFEALPLHPDGRSAAGAATPSRPGLPSQSEPDYRRLAEAFLAEIIAAEERSFASVGYGIDYHYVGKQLAGSALVHADELIHAVFLRVQ